MPPTAIEPEHFDWLDYRKYTFSLGLTAGADVFLSGHSASCYDPGEARVVVRGGAAEQCRTAYEKIGVLLEACGLGPENVVHVVEYVPAAAIDLYPEIAGVRAEALAGASPAVSTVIVRRLLRRNAFVEVEVTARADPQPEAASSAGGLSATAGDLVYLSSMLGVDRRGDLVDGGVEAQAEQIYDNVERVLAAANLNCTHLVKTLDYISVRGRCGLQVDRTRAPRPPRAGLSRGRRNNRRPPGPSGRAAAGGLRCVTRPAAAPSTLDGTVTRS